MLKIYIDEILVNHIFNGLSNLYYSCKNLNPKEPLIVFQQAMSRIGDLPQTKLDEDYEVLKRALVRNSKDEAWFKKIIEILFRNVAKNTLEKERGILVESITDLPVEHLNIPDMNQLIHLIHLQSARNVYQVANLFSDKHNEYVRSSNIVEIKNLIENAVITVIQNIIDIKKLSEHHDRKKEELRQKGGAQVSDESEKEDSDTEEESEGGEPSPIHLTPMNLSKLNETLKNKNKDLPDIDMDSNGIEHSSEHVSSDDDDNDHSVDEEHKKVDNLKDDSESDSDSDTDIVDTENDSDSGLSGSESSVTFDTDSELEDAKREGLSELIDTSESESEMNNILDGEVSDSESESDEITPDSDHKKTIKLGVNGIDIENLSMLSGDIEGSSSSDREDDDVDTNEQILLEAGEIDDSRANIRVVKLSEKEKIKTVDSSSDESSELSKQDDDSDISDNIVNQTDSQAISDEQLKKVNSDKSDVKKMNHHDTISNLVFSNSKKPRTKSRKHYRNKVVNTSKKEKSRSSSKSKDINIDDIVNELDIY